MTPKQKLALLATIIGSGVVFLDSSIVNLALPKMADAMHSGFASQQWIVDGYALPLSALLLLGGSMGDIYGRKKVYFWGVFGFGLMSLACALAPNIQILIASRVLQGIFGALMVPGALAIINTNFPKGLRGKAIGLWTAATSGIIALGPLLGGYILDFSSWRWIFLINIPLLLAVIWLGLPSIEENAASTKRKLDAVGAGLVFLGLSGLTFGLIEGPAMQWTMLPKLMLALGMVFLVIFIRYEQKKKDPMLQLELFKSRNFTAANVATFAIYGALGGFFFSLLIYAQTMLHYSALEVGLMGLPVSIFMILFSSKVGALSSKYGPRFFMTTGPIIASGGIWLMLPLHPGSAYLTAIFPGILLFGIGLSLIVAPLTTTVLASVKESNSGIASAVNNAVARVAGLVIIAFLGIFGAENSFHFAIFLCGSLTIAAGILSFLLVQNSKNR